MLFEMLQKLSNNQTSASGVIAWNPSIVVPAIPISTLEELDVLNSSLQRPVFLDQMVNYSIVLVLFHGPNMLKFILDC